MRPGAMPMFMGAALLTLVLFSCAPDGTQALREDTGEERQRTEASSSGDHGPRLSTTEVTTASKASRNRGETTVEESSGPSKSKDASKNPENRSRKSVSETEKPEKAHRQPERTAGDEKAPPQSSRQTKAGQQAERAESPPPRPWGSCSHPLVLVDRQFGLSPGYAPWDLVYLSTYGIPAYGGDGLLREEAAASLARLVAAASASGEELVVASAYRSYYDQQSSYANWTSYYGAGAGGVSAPPGHSEHQLGTAVDFTNSAAGYQIGQIFGQTTAAWWLAANAHNYGFVMSYPSGKEAQTGYAWEPWHYRYIGVENAARLHESGLSLREFLLQEGVRPGC